MESKLLEKTLKTRGMSEEERNDVMDSMSENLDSQNEPQVGIFWYIGESHSLFGVNKAYASELQFDERGLKTTNLLHRTWWQKQKNRLASKGEKLGVFQKSCTMVPRGRIFQREDGTFQMMCGSWIDEQKKSADEIEELVKEEFELNSVPFERIIDKHWEIGQGWDG
jgi:hypothetical protein